NRTHSPQRRADHQGCRGSLGCPANQLRQAARAQTVTRAIALAPDRRRCTDDWLAGQPFSQLPRGSGPPSDGAAAAIAGSPAWPRKWRCTSSSMRTVSTMPVASLATALARVGLLEPFRIASISSKIASRSPALVRTIGVLLVGVVFVLVAIRLSHI